MFTNIPVCDRVVIIFNWTDGGMFLLFIIIIRVSVI